MTEILSNWEQFCLDVGNSRKRYKVFDLFVNESVKLSTSFANCAICVPSFEADVLEAIGEIRTLSRSSTITAYSFGEKDLGPNGIESKKSVLMVLKERAFGNAEYEVQELSINDIGAFTDVTFQSFGYPEEFRQDSQTLYQRALRSRKVHIYGIVIRRKLVSCLLSHETKRCIGIELVSTLPQFRGKGIAISLLLRVIRNHSQEKTVWLLANEGQNAERLYSKIGFQALSKVQSVRIPQG